MKRLLVTLRRKWSNNYYSFYRDADPEKNPQDSKFSICVGYVAQYFHRQGSDITPDKILLDVRSEPSDGATEALIENDYQGLFINGEFQSVTIPVERGLRERNLAGQKIYFKFTAYDNTK